MAILLLALFLDASAATAQGSIAGCVTDKNGGTLPGVEVVASGPSAQQKVVTGVSGCFELSNLPAGTYAVTAALAGFVSGKRENVVVGSGRTVDHLDFTLCTGPLGEILWITPGSLANTWNAAAVVARVRIEATEPVRAECPTNDVLHTASIIEIFKGAANGPAGETLTFRQEIWAGERAPYRIGQEMIVFLAGKQGQFARVAGPFFVFLIDGDDITSPDSAAEVKGMTPAGFMARLRTMAKGAYPMSTSATGTSQWASTSSKRRRSSRLNVS
jgi:hypothetical protein